ncbi:Uncharacterised protein [Bordetella pertussis]|nr:Uncharacterised protein [Bordetella pertussis]
MRLSRLYGFWIVATLGSPCFSAACRKRATPHGVSLDRPTWRTLPARTKSCSTSSVSSIGTVWASSTHG